MTALWGRGVLRQRKTKIDRRLIQNPAYGPVVFYNKSAPHAVKILCAGLFRILSLRQHRIIPALRLKHRSGGCGTASALQKCSIIHKVLSALLLSSCRASLAVSALRIVRCCLESCLCLWNIRHFLCFQVHLKCKLINRGKHEPAFGFPVPSRSKTSKRPALLHGKIKK